MCDRTSVSTHRWSPVCLFVILSCLAGTVPARSSWSTEPNRAIEFEATSLNGQTFKAQELAGQVVLVDFWATWCGPCVKAFSTLNSLAAEFRKQGFEVVGVASYSGTLEDIQQFLRSRTVEYPVVAGDEDLIERFGVVGYPTYFLIDRQGRLAETYVGEIESQLETVKDRIRTLLKAGESTGGRR